MRGISTDTTPSPRPAVVIPGGSGFLGRALSRFLHGHGYAVTILSRSSAPVAGLPPGTSVLQWDNRTLGGWVSSLNGACAVVNFVGRSVDCRKTAENTRAILDSRVDSCRVLGEAMRSVDHPPPVWIQPATAHFVGDPEPQDSICDESTPPGPMHEMAPAVGVAWEHAFNEARLPGQRGVVMRISFVLGAQGGAFERLRTLTRLGLGGTVGSGSQWISWIHESDLHRLMRAAIEDESYQGVYMVTAPSPITNREFMRALRHVYHRPWSPPRPPSLFASRAA